MHNIDHIKQQHWNIAFGALNEEQIEQLITARKPRKIKQSKVKPAAEEIKTQAHQIITRLLLKQRPHKKILTILKRLKLNYMGREKLQQKITEIRRSKGINRQKESNEISMKVKQLFYANKTNAEIAAELDTTKQAVAARLHKLKLKRKPWHQ